VKGLADPAALPHPDAVSSPYFEAAAQGRLLFQRCAAGHAFLYPRALCPFCHERRLRWERSAGLGEVVSFVVVHRAPWDDLPRPLPYAVVLVRLDEGPQLLSTLEEVAHTRVRIGMRVRAAFERVDERVGLVRFVPADDL
jgi:uncharacterized OB-fold protein